MRAALLIFLTACLGGHAPLPKARAADRGAKLVRAVIPFASELAWKRTPWWRMSDQTYPWNVVIATDDTACLLSSDVVFIPNPRDYWVCVTPWRVAR